MATPEGDFESYKQRLKEWTENAAKREGNINSLQQQMTVTLSEFGLRAPAPQHLYRWKDGDVLAKIKDPTLTKIGIYRAVREFNVPSDQVDQRAVREQTRSWLEGLDLKVQAKKSDDKKHPVFKYLEHLAESPSGKVLIPELIVFLVNLWKIKDGLVSYGGGSMPANAVADLLSGVIEESDYGEVLQQSGLPEERIQAILSGEIPNAEELESLAAVIPGFAAGDLAALISSDLGFTVS